MKGQGNLESALENKKEMKKNDILQFFYTYGADSHNHCHEFLHLTDRNAAQGHGCEC